MQFYPLKVLRIQPETPDTRTIEFHIPDKLSDLFTYQAGQYITVRHSLDGQEVRRAYSMSSSPLEKRLAITVKKLAGGRMSTFLHDTLKEGDTLEVAPPDGRFTVKFDPDKRRTFYLFGAGSGITPLMSILKTVLEAEPMSTIFLLYGSRNEENIIFRDELERLSQQYAGQLHVEHILSRPKKVESGNFIGLFKRYTTNWNGRTGRITGSVVEAFLEENPPHTPAAHCEYFICGPGNMAEVVKTALLKRGVKSKQIHTELFINATSTPSEGAEASANGGARLIVHLNRVRIETTVPPNATILDVLIREKYDVPYSCTAGACSTCMAKVLKGRVRMDTCYALDEEEIKAGYCLTCQAHPETEEVEITYDM
ncbi:MAG: ferredoxin--NADP reductase [Saprospiraceae bacterium]|nr:ferredoxin--NADP reductase [Saprospiraceae bacterium]MDW8484146.1 ferredoxin--NADP reductase [Saprospiraceae bacterium]